MDYVLTTRKVVDSATYARLPGFWLAIENSPLFIF
jgi:hypothetical protein